MAPLEDDAGVAVWLVTQVFINNMWTTWQVTYHIKVVPLPNVMIQNRVLVD